ncbi:GNAT family N-acetyltransferase [Pseudomonas sp. dw_358]|uniref:GNAT family N-acetyltransferase n=1 Tax=Pseudomonas sp. dw_358 TaxID=2720083 RepID=UPI001BD3FCD0|nr:GNAT family N-acetyltransferase [Pseudomonas sp. dw_358]
MATPIAAESLLLRPMTEADLPEAYALSQKLSWPHRLEDWQMMLRLSHGVVFEEGGRVIGTAFCCVQGGWSTIGLVIIADEYQGRGLGRQLMNAALALSGDAVATLTATAEGAPLYEKLGFVACGQLVQHHAVLAGDYEAPAHPYVRGLRDDEIDAAVALAETASGFKRDAVLAELLAISERVHVTEAEGELTGLAILRSFGRGMMIGPVIARDPAHAHDLIESLLGYCAGRFVRLDVTLDSGLSPWLSALGLVNVGEPVQMARGRAPAGTVGVKQFGVVTQALG